MFEIEKETSRPPVICDNCPSCPIWRQGLSPRQVVIVRQPQVLHEPVVLFVGQHPSKDELEKDMAFVGYSSEEFVSKLRDLGLWDYSVLTNIIKCAILPETKVSDEALRLAAKHCFINLSKEIQKFQPKFICLLGTIAAGEFFKGIHVKRPPHGEFVQWRGIWVCWTYHPAAAVRNPNLWEPISDVLLSIKRRINTSSQYTSQSLKYEVVSTPEEIDQICEYFASKEVIACDIEVDVIDHTYAGYQLATRGKTKAAQIIAFGLSDGERTVVIANRDGSLDFSQLTSLRNLIFSPKPKKVYHNALFELMWFHRIWGEVPPPRTFADTMLMYYVLAEDREDHEYGLKNLAVRLLGAPEWADARIQEARKTGLGKLSLEELYGYNAQDTYWTLKLYQYLEPQVREADLNFLLSELVYPLECLYASATDRGIRVNAELLGGEMANIVRRRLDNLVAEIRQLSKGYIRNPRSWQEKKFYLYQVLKLQPPQEGEETTRRSVLNYFLEHYPEHQEILSRLIEFSQLDKLYSSYLSQWTKFVDIDGRIRPEFKFFGTKTGRLSVEEPPFHNFPSERTQSGKEARRIFIPTEGYCFLDCDASQFEVRVMAAKSGDPNLIEAFFGGHDVYTEVASIIFQKPPEQINRKTERQVAKQVVLGIFYGMSPVGLAQLLRLTEEEATLYINRLREHYPKVFQYMDNVRDFGRQYGFVRNWLGRYRRAYAATRGDPRALRQIGNFVIQSEASDWWQMVTLWFFRLAYRRLGKDIVHILATIHDSMLAEVKLGYEEQAAECLRDAMILVSTLWQLQVPIDGEYRFCYESLGEDSEKQPLGVTQGWRESFAERGKQLLQEFKLSPYPRRGL